MGEIWGELERKSGRTIEPKQFHFVFFYSFFFLLFSTSLFIVALHSLQKKNTCLVWFLFGWMGFALDSIRIEEHIEHRKRARGKKNYSQVKLHLTGFRISMQIQIEQGYKIICSFFCRNRCPVERVSDLCQDNLPSWYCQWKNRFMFKALNSGIKMIENMRNRVIKMEVLVYKSPGVSTLFYFYFLFV